MYLPLHVVRTIIVLLFKVYIARTMFAQVTVAVHLNGLDLLVIPYYKKAAFHCQYISRSDISMIPGLTDDQLLVVRARPHMLHDTGRL